MDKLSERLLSGFLINYWAIPSDALIRTAEGILWSKQKFIRPVVDIGCGDGNNARYLFSKQGKIDLGIDSDEVGVRLAKKCKKYKKVILANAQNLKLTDRSFRTVISNSTFEHIENDEMALKEVSRILKKNGRFIFCVPTPRFVEFLSSLGMGKRELKLYNNRVSHFRYRTVDAWQKFLGKNGLKIISYEYYFPIEVTRIWLKLFKLATFKPYRRELWSYLTDSIITRFIPRKFLINFWKMLLVGYTKNIVNNNGGWVFIVAQKV